MPLNVTRRPGEAALVVTVVLAVHAVLLGGGLELLGEFEPAALPRDKRAVTVRQIVREAPGQAPRLAASITPAPAPLQRQATRNAKRNATAAPAPAAAVEEGASIESALPAAPESLPALPVANLPELIAAIDPAPAVEGASLAPQALPPAPLQAPAPEGSGPPIHLTRIAPSFRLDYRLQRGPLSGSAELSWRRAGDRYELELKGSVVGVDAMWLISRGGFDSAGLAPDRFVDRRRGRDRHAANFDRAAGRISYSGPQTTHPLLAGAQDRLSWMVQLPAIIDADPARFVAGTRVPVFVSGARGDADTWVFVVEGLQADSPTPGLRLTREPRRPYDTQVEVWLDPVRYHLPVRARLTTLPGGDTLELVLDPRS